MMWSSAAGTSGNSAMRAPEMAAAGQSRIDSPGHRLRQPSRLAMGAVTLSVERYRAFWGSSDTNGFLKASGSWASMQRGGGI
jgi:hypothetical protein